MKALKSSTPQNRHMIIAALLGCSALVVPSVAGATASVPAKTSWAISRVASISQGSYCTMAQKYADATVLTFAKNGKGEYSLAVDFRDGHFKSGEKQTITLRPQGGAAQTYSITPQSDRTAVVGIGKDTTMMKQIANTQSLSLEISGTSIQYAMAEFETGQKELGNCIDALQTQKGKDADLVKSEKTGVSSPEAVVNRQVAVVNAAAEPSVEGLLAAKPTPAGAATDVAAVAASALSSADMAPPPVPVAVVAKEEIKHPAEKAVEKAEKKVVPMEQKVEEKQPETIAWKEEQKPVVTTTAKADNGAEKEIAALREENARLSRAMTEQRQAFENQKATANGAAVDELRQKLETAQAENDKLRSLQTENQSLKGQLATQVAAKAQAAPVVAQDKDNKFQHEIETLKTENAALQNQIQAYQTKQATAADAQSKNTSAVAADIAKLQSENAQLKTQLAAAKSAPLVPPAPPVAMPVVASAESDKLQKEVRDLRNQMGSVEAEKSALQAQLDKLQKETDTRQIKMAGGNWDLEQATRRYQESQREIQRLGAMVQSQQSQCVKEKKDIEYMLFDPAIAKSSQISMLNSLEEQIAEKDKKIKAMESEMSSLKAQAAPDKDQKIADLQKQLDGARSEMASKMNQAETSQNTVIASLKEQLAQKDKALFDAQAKLAAAQNETAKAAAQVVQTKAVETSAQEATITSLKTQLAETQKQLDAQRLAAQQAGAKASADQASSLATLQMQIQQGNQKINELQNQISGLRSAALQAAAVAPAAAPAPLPAPVPVAPVAVAPVVPSAPVSLAPQTPQQQPTQSISFAAPKSAPAKFLSLDEFSGLLKTAGVPVNGGLQQIQGGDPASYRAYSWKTSSLYGSVEMRQVTDPTAFDTVIGQYLGRAKSRCSGEFAAVPSPVKAANVSESKSYEIACVNAGASSSASVLFTYGNGVVMTVAHEGRAEAMDMAMDARDRIAGQLR